MTPWRVLAKFKEPYPAPWRFLDTAVATTPQILCDTLFFGVPRQRLAPSQLCAGNISTK
jgi:hypothetical protein